MEAGTSVLAETRKNDAHVGGIPDNRESPADQPEGQEAVLQQGVASVPAGTAFSLSFTTATKFRIRCGSIPDDIASLFRIQQLSVGDRNYVLGSSGSQTGGTALITGVRGTNFNEFSQCANILADQCVQPGKPVSIQGTNVSVAPADFEMVFRGNKLPDEC